MGHYNYPDTEGYYGVPNNGITLNRFKTAISRLWLKRLKQRSQKINMNWKKLTKSIRYFLPNAKILHPYPNQRFCV